MCNTMLIAEDDKTALKVLARYFRACGFTVCPVESNAEAIKLAGESRFDCFLLDYHLADGPSTGICRFVRGHKLLCNTPIIMLSGDPGQSIKSYDICQADVFVEKGRGCREILAVVKRQLRRMEWERGILKRSDLTLDMRSMCLFKADRPIVRLSPEQFRFLEILISKSPDFVTENDICAHVFAEMPAVRREAISSLVYRLRRKLGPRLSRRIKSTRFRGWIYIQPRCRREESSLSLSAV